jgi:hypothetical protein
MMTERLIAKLDRLGAEAGIKEMTSEIYRFAQLLNDEKMRQWDAWRAKREWVGLTDEDRYEFAAAQYSWEELLIAAEAKLKEKNT